MIFTNAVAKRDFYLIQHFGVKMSSVTRCPQRKDSRVKLSCFVLLTWSQMWSFDLEK